METLRNFTLLARFVLVWMVLSLGAAVASPIVKPQNVFLICTGAGAMKVLIATEDGSITEMGSSSMDCPLCATAGAPPPIAIGAVLPVQSLAYALQSIPSAHIAARTAAPLPARGPPQL